jgi:hypothetical protein
MEVLLGLLAVTLLIAAALVRLAPSDPERWHIDPATAPDPEAGGVKTRVTYNVPDALARFEAALMAEPRITLLAGTPEEGRMTFVARSLVMGFPDYITVSREDTELVILSRLRFGRSDLGVNRARLERVLDRL